MSSSSDSDLPFLPEVGDGPRLQAPPKAMVRIAAVAILALALFGLIRGAISSRPAIGQAASPLAVLAGLSPAATAAAKPAQILPRDDMWSTLSGPRMLDAQAKPAPQARPVESDDEDDDSASPAAQVAAADAITPDAPDAPPAAAAASSNSAPAPATPPT